MTPKRTLSALAIAAITAQGVFATAAVAAPGKDYKHHKAEMSLTDFDTDGNGEVSVTEYDAAIAEKMSNWHGKKGNWNANAGNADDDSRAAGDHPTKTPPKGADADTDGDGIISEEEFSAQKDQMRHKGKGHDANASEGRAGNAGNADDDAMDDVADTTPETAPGTELGNDGNADDDTVTN